MLRLNDQYENRPYVEEFTKECNVMFVYGTYVLEGEEDAEFSYGDTAWNYLEKTSDLPLNTKIINQIHKIMMEDERVLVGEYRKSSAFAGYHTFASASRNERWMEDAIFRFHETKKDDPIMAATNLFGNINMHPFEDGNERICRLVLVHVLIQMKCCLFPVILSSYHRPGRRHDIRAVKMFDRKPSTLYTMIVKSLIHCWDNFEQNAKNDLAGP